MRFRVQALGLGFRLWIALWSKYPSIRMWMLGLGLGLGLKFSSGIRIVLVCKVLEPLVLDLLLRLKIGLGVSIR